MSLINEMLRDLEAKRPDDLLKQNLQREIRSLPAISTGSGRWLKWLLMIIVLLGGVVFWLQSTGQLGRYFELFVEAPPALSPVVPTAPSLAQAPVPETAAVDRVSEPNFAGLQVARALEFVPLPVIDSMQIAEPLPALTPAALSPIAATVANPEPEKLPAAAAKSLIGGLSGPVKIDKSPVLATPRDRADAEYRRAETAVSAGHHDEAIALLRDALRIDPPHVQIRQTLLRLLLGQRKPLEAMRVLNEGLAISPEQIGWAISLARLQLEQGDLVAADRSLFNSQSFAQSNADYAGFQGHLKSRLGDHRQAAAYYSSATRLAPAEGRWWLGLGLALEAEGKLEDAKEAFRRSLASENLPGELSTMAKQYLR